MSLLTVMHSQRVVRVAQDQRTLLGIRAMVQLIRPIMMIKILEQDFLVQRVPMDNKKNNEKGQSTVEFILTFAFGVSLILVIFNTAMNFATGYLVHYATFMASRVYLTQDNMTGTIGNSSPALAGSVDTAKAAFNVYNLSIFNVENSSFKINPAGDNDPSAYMTVGGVTTFELNIDILGKVAGSKKLEMTSESFLGKEVTRAECASRTCFGITGQESCDDSYDITLFDDGC